MITNKRRKPIKKPGKPTPIRKARNHAIRMNMEAIAQKEFDRNILREEEIGVHPKFRNRQSRFYPEFIKSWEDAAKTYEEMN